jgi:hypothetical protein
VSALRVETDGGKFHWTQKGGHEAGLGRIFSGQHPSSARSVGRGVTHLDTDESGEESDDAMATAPQKPRTTRKEHPMKEPDDRSRRGFLKASSMLGLAVAFRPAAIGEGFADSKSNTAQKENTMT